MQVEESNVNVKLVEGVQVPVMISRNWIFEGSKSGESCSCLLWQGGGGTGSSAMDVDR